MSPAESVRATLADLERGLTQLPLAAAVGHIDGWHQALAASERADLRAVADGLGELRELLAGPGLSADAVGRLLARLGEQTGAAAEHADDPDTAKAVARLGDLLFHAGHALRGPRPQPA